MGTEPENTLREGIDRRSDDLGKDTEQRSGKERRSVMANPYSYIGILEKIPMFKGLRVDQFKKILHICSKQIFLLDEVICAEGDESFRMFILLKGSLKVIFADGKEFSRISSVGMVGEMGVFTGERRSASVVGAEEGVLISIHKAELFKLFRHDTDLGIKILLNVILDVSHKLKKSNAIIDELKKWTN